MAGSTFKVRRVRSEDERSSGSGDYITLGEGEKFLGVALFEGDPKVDEPGYFEYLDHWIDGKGIPCAGDNCIYCEDGDRPRSRAKSLWYVLKDEKGRDVNAVRIFNLSSTLIKAVTELRGEGDKIKGMTFRVAHPDQRTYNLIPKTDRAMPVKDIKENLKGAADLEALVTAQLKKAMEGVAVSRAMEDDDDDETPAKEKRKAKEKAAPKGKAGAKKKTAEWPSSLDEEEVIVVEVDDDGNFIEVRSENYDGTMKVYTDSDIDFDLTDLGEGQIVTVTTGDQDDDGDYVLSAEPEAGEATEEEDGDEAEETEEGDNDLPDSIEGEQFTVVSVNESESTIDVKNDDYEFTLYFLDTMDIDFEDYPEGANITVSAEKDRSGDLVATEVPKVKKAAAKKGTGRKTATAKKGK